MQEADSYHLGKKLPLHGKQGKSCNFFYGSLEKSPCNWRLPDAKLVHLKKKKTHNVFGHSSNHHLELFFNVVASFRSNSLNSFAQCLRCEPFAIGGPEALGLDHVLSQLEQKNSRPRHLGFLFRKQQIRVPKKT